MSLDPDEYIDSESWLDMDVGDTGIVFGKLDSVSFSGDGLVVSFSDWSQLAITTPNAGANNMFRSIKPARRTDPTLERIIPSNAHVMVRVRRTEDGVEGLAIWTVGGVPIPLVNAA